MISHKLVNFPKEVGYCKVFYYWIIQIVSITAYCLELLH